MKAAQKRFPAAAGLAGKIGLIALLPAAVLLWREPAAFAPAWRCAVFACVGPALGSLVFVLIHLLTGGEWGRALRSPLLAGTRLLPWSWLAALPLAAMALANDAPDYSWHYASPLPLALRALFFGAVFFFVSLVALRAWPREAHRAHLAWIGPVGLIGILFLTHLLATDWLAALDPHWISTAFPLVWLVGQSVAGLAAAILVALLAGADPAQSTGRERKLGLDLGTLLFAAAMTWCYVAFAQFLIVWSGNLPVETSWYAQRLAGAWRFIPAALLLLHFLAPLAVLLSRRAKQNRPALAIVAALLLVAQLLQTMWMVLPAFPNASPGTPWLALVLVVALGGLFTNRYLCATQRFNQA